MNTLDTFSRPLFRYGEFVPNLPTPPRQLMAFTPDKDDTPTQNAYAFGRLRVQFPTESVQREFNRIARLPGEKTLEAASAKQILSDEMNFDLAHDLDWILTIDGQDSYLVQARSNMELKQMIRSLVMTPGEIAYHIITGVIGPEVTLTNGQCLPSLRCDFLMAFTFKEFINRICEETHIDEALATDMFEKLLILSNNPGRELTDIALNYSMLNCMEIYQFAAQLEDHGTSSSQSYNFVDAFVIPAKLQGQKQLVDVIYKYRMRGSEQTLLRACKIDVSHEYPYIAGFLEPYFPSP